MHPLTLEAPRVAVIDIGSNTIKSMVLEGPSPGTVIHTETLEARLGADRLIDGARLTPEAVERGAQAVASLWNHLQPFDLSSLRVVATSAVRDASNQVEFSDRVEQLTGVKLDILSGEDEARGVAAAIQADPLFQNESFLTTSDLGGGSLEMVAIRHHHLSLVRSFQIGAVRFLAHYVPEPDRPIGVDSLDAISQKAANLLRPTIEAEQLQQAAVHVATGGAFTIARALLAERAKVPIEGYGPAITADEIFDLARETGALAPGERTGRWAIPPGRADVFPIALAILKGLADALETNVLYHSFANLRKGLALDLLQKLSSTRHE